MMNNVNDRWIYTRVTCIRLVNIFLKGDTFARYDGSREDSWLIRDIITFRERDDTYCKLHWHFGQLQDLTRFLKIFTCFAALISAGNILYKCAPLYLKDRLPYLIYWIVGVMISDIIELFMIFDGTFLKINLSDIKAGFTSFMHLRTSITNNCNICNICMFIPEDINRLE